jgi:hypothetical protein
MLVVHHLVLSMIFSENRFPLFRIMLYAAADACREAITTPASTSK